MNTIISLLNPNNTLAVNRPLAHAIGVSEAIIYSALLSKYKYYEGKKLLKKVVGSSQQHQIWKKAQAFRRSNKRVASRTWLLSD